MVLAKWGFVVFVNLRLKANVCLGEGWGKKKSMDLNGNDFLSCFSLLSLGRGQCKEVMVYLCFGRVNNAMESVFC